MTLYMNSWNGYLVTFRVPYQNSLEECIAALVREDSLKPTVKNVGLKESILNSVVRIGNFATENDVIPKGTISKHLRSTRISPDGKNRIQIDRILKDWRWHVLDVPVICNTDHYLVVTNVRERLSVGNLAMAMDILI